jgi:hypothetical protein
MVSVASGVACGSDPSPGTFVDGGTSGTSTGTTPPPPSPDGGVVENQLPPPAPKPDELTEAFGIFVSPQGTPDGDGTRKKPLSTLSAGMKRAKTDKKRLYACAGTYPEALKLEDGVSVLATFDCTTWALGTEHAKVDSPTSPAVEAKGIATPTRIDGLYVRAPAGTPEAPSSIAVLALDSSGLTFVDAQIEAREGASGVAGTSPAPLVANPVAPGDRLAPAACDRGFPNYPACTATKYVVRDGSVGGVNTCRRADGTSFGMSQGGRGAASGVYGGGLSIGIGTPAAGTPGGAPASSGTSSNGGSFTEEGFTPGDGTAGSNGALGAGGAGGVAVVDVSAADSVIRWTSNGPGGGAGGCPGLAGSAGKGGGASIALLTFRSPIGLERSTIRSANGGSGGAGSFGSDATSGQPGGNPVYQPVVVAGGARPGEPGGPAGVSGHGAGGPSIGVAHKAGAPRVVDSKFVIGAPGESPGAEQKQDIVGGTTRTIPAATPAVAKNVHPLDG